MGRFGLVYAFVALFLVASAATQSGSNNATTTVGPSTSVPSITVATPPESSTNVTKEGLGEGRYRNNHGRHERRGYGHRRNYDNSHEYDDFHSYKARPYFDTHYCSVHGSFRLAYNEKVDKKEYGSGDNYQSGGQSYGGQSYGNQEGGYNQGGSYGNQEGGYGNQGYGQNNYGNQGGYEKKSYKDEHRYLRKTTRQYCRYAAAWSEKACRFCCKVVARSAYTNPDDIIAAIFSFDPADPASGGAGIEQYGKKDNYESSNYESNNYESNSYGGQQGGYGGNQGGYEQGGYGGGQSYDQGNNYNQGSSYNQPAYSPPAYGNGPYRSKRNSEYVASPGYEQQSGGEQYSQTPGAYSQQPDHGNKYENESYKSNGIPQCVCCAPKQRYY